MFRSFVTPRPPAARSAWAAALALSALVAPPVRADDEAGPTALTVTPQAEPVPALRYRLLPSAAELNPGDAAPVYMRLYAETLTEAKRQISEKASAWLDEPFDEFPLQEARDFVETWSSRTARMAFAARRSQCDWAYTLPEEREEAYNILLPDLQELRNFARLLALKARVEIAEGTYDEAIRTIETGLAMARHLAEGPFLINNLVGLAVANQFIDRVEELVARPGAPNLYWALASLPRPLIDMRDALEIEQAMADWIVPELSGLDQLRSEQDWEARLALLHGRLFRLDRELSEGNPDREPTIPARIEEFRSEHLADARAYFVGREATMPGSEAERVVRFIAERNRQVIDDAYKHSYLPIDEVLAHYARLGVPVEQGLVFLPLLPTTQPGEIAASVRTVHLFSQARFDRRVAALRVVEAIRLHAAANGGALPGALDEIEEVPVPVDPISGEPFSYRLDGESAILDAPETPVEVPSGNLPYRMTIRE
jgi:hypothetical protein